MKLFDQMERINRLHELIRHRRTGTPRQLATRLGISEARVYQIIEDLKCYDVPIEYSRQKQSYYYAYSYEIRLTALLRPLDADETKNVLGGLFYAPVQTHVSFFSE